MNRRLYWLTAFCLMLLFSCTSKAQEPDPNFYIYLCFGQSNMEGVANQTHFEPQDLEGVSDRFLYLSAYNGNDALGHTRTKGTWSTAYPPLCRANTFLTPADYFGRTMAERLPDKRIGVVMVAVGGMTIKGFLEDHNAVDAANATWGNYLYENHYLYDELLELAKKAQQDGVIKGILMLQGEADQGQSWWAGDVKKVYNDLLSDLNLKASEVPFLAGQTLINGTIFNTTNEQNIDFLPNVISTAHVISAEGCETSSDYIHFTAEGYRKIGKRFAAKELELLGMPEETLQQQREPYLDFYKKVQNMYNQPFNELRTGAHANLSTALSTALRQIENATTITSLEEAKSQLLDAAKLYIADAEPIGIGRFDITFLINTPDVSYAKIGSTLPDAWFTEHNENGAFHFVINNKVPWTSSSVPSGDFTAAYGHICPTPATSGFTIYQKVSLPAGKYLATASCFGWGTEINGTWKGTYPPHFTFSAGDNDGTEINTETYAPSSVNFNLDAPVYNLKIGIKAQDGNDCPWTAMANTHLYKVPEQKPNMDEVLQGWTKITELPADADLDNYYFAICDKNQPLMVGLGLEVYGYNGAVTRCLNYQTPCNPLDDPTKVFMITRTQNWDWNDGTKCYSMLNLSYPSLYLQTEWASPWFYRIHDQSTPIGWTALIPQYNATGDYWTFLNGVYPRANANNAIGNGAINSEDWGYLGPWNTQQYTDGSSLAANKKDEGIGHFMIFSIPRSLFDDMTTGISNVFFDDNLQNNIKSTNNIAYDLQGRIVNFTFLMDLKPGIYIVDGKKILIR